MTTTGVIQSYDPNNSGPPAPTTETVQYASYNDAATNTVTAQQEQMGHFSVDEGGSLLTPEPPETSTVTQPQED